MIDWKDKVVIAICEDVGVKTEDDKDILNYLSEECTWLGGIGCQCLSRQIKECFMLEKDWREAVKKEKELK